MGEIVFVVTLVVGLIVFFRILGWLGRSNLFAIVWGVGCVVLSFWMIGNAFFGGQ